MCLATAGTERTPASMKHGEFDIPGSGGGQQFALCLQQGPACRREVGVDIAVGYTQHDDLVATARREVIPVAGLCMELADQCSRIAETTDGFESGRDIQRDGILAPQSLAPLCQQQCGQNVVDTFGHADDIGTDRFLAKAPPAEGDGLEDADGPLALVVEVNQR